ncbi:hypothetical protein [Shewanella dokdonensis]|uniref:Uncharacterized protein n=1 Tax=Shewanella dokdonensis TaxID=712036 RepID=A0ABX8DFM5_9GAMM|nr:hypothetical protein [Shewanella dokdonensis]MCL1075143.1 hypothetical protein [Shewanella dokdonensis]QVK23538.1 hypothetical protein KHX94_01860 [Shewanella dokdonensis]
MKNHTAAPLTINNIFVKEFCVFIKAGAEFPFKKTVDDTSRIGWGFHKRLTGLYAEYTSMLYKTLGILRNSGVRQHLVYSTTR